MKTNTYRVTFTNGEMVNVNAELVWIDVITGLVHLFIENKTKPGFAAILKVYGTEQCENIELLQTERLEEEENVKRLSKEAFGHQTDGSTPRGIPK